MSEAENSPNSFSFHRKGGLMTKDARTALEKLETNAAGEVVLRPVMGWTTSPIAGTAILLRVNYAETPPELQTGGRHIQFAMTPEQALELSQTLTSLAHRILQAPSTGKPN